MTDIATQQNARRYHLRLFPPIGDGDKYYFDDVADLAIHVKRLYDKFKMEELDSTGVWFNQWKRDPIDFFCEHVQLTIIDKNKCTKHKKLFK